MGLPQEASLQEDRSGGLFVVTVPASRHRFACGACGRPLAGNLAGAIAAMVAFPTAQAPIDRARGAAVRAFHRPYDCEPPRHYSWWRAQNCFA